MLAPVPTSPAAARARWPVRIFDLGEEPSDDLSRETTLDERLAMMQPLALAAWTVSGKRLSPRRRAPLALLNRKPRRRHRRP
jgi:DMSO/TMAO reductase YedYZ molybdopterin-dependent catalytic subunit